jgi:hypothetical protein
MKKILLLFSCFLFSTFSFGQIIISQVYEGEGNNKWIEITNTSLNDIDLSSPIQYKVGIWQIPGSSGNGVLFGSPTNYISLTGTLAKGHRYLIKNTNAATNIPHPIMPVAENENTTVASLDGNDAIAIFTDSNTIIDAFGVGINYSNISYIRSQSIVMSKPSFDVSQWTQNSLSSISSYGTNSNNYIGIHNYNGLFYTNSSLVSINKEYGAISPVGSFTLTRVSSAFSSADPGIAPPPPGITPPIFIYAPSDFETCMSENFSTAIGTETTPLMVDNSNSILLSKTIYYRLKSNATSGNKNGNFKITFDIAPQLVYTDYYVPTHPVNLVTPKTVTITGLMANDKVFDGNTLATLSGTPVLNGIIASDDTNVSLEGSVIANFNDATVGNNKPVAVIGYSLSGSASNNYLVQQPIGLTASILPTGLLSQTISFNTIPTNVTYGDVDFNLIASSSSNLPITFSSSDPAIVSILGTTVTVLGAGTVTITASQVGNSEYEPALDVNQTITILPKTLTVSGIVVNDKIYDGTPIATTSGGLIEGVINSDEVTFVANANFIDNNVGNTKQVTIAYSLNLPSTNKYVISNSLQTASIFPKELSIIGLTGNSKSYDGTDMASTRGEPTLVGVLLNDVFNVAIAGNPVANFDTPVVGINKPILISGYTLDGVSASNYLLMQPTNVVADITAKSVSISGVSVSNKEYNRSTNATIVGAPILNGVVVGEEVDVTLVGTVTAVFDNFNVGTNKTVTVSGVSLSGALSGNYFLEPLSLTASITKKSLTISGATAADKSYDGTTAATLSGTIAGVISPDNVVLNLFGNFNDAQVGQNKPVTSTSTITGTSASNYLLLQPQGLTATITGNPCNVADGFALWNGASAAVSMATYQGLVVSSIERGNNNGSNGLVSTSSPSNYSGASGTSNFTISAFVGALNLQTSSYLQFTITPNANSIVTINGISFGSRSNSNGPQAYSLRSSVDNYVSSLGNGVLSANGQWSFNNLTINQNSTTTPIIYRLYGYAGTGSNTVSIANWRVDDLKVTLTVASTPALSSDLTATICSGTSFNYTPTTTYANSTISWTRQMVAGISNDALTASQFSSPDEVLVNTTNAPIDVTYAFAIAFGGCVLNQNVVVTVNPSSLWYEDADGDGFGNSLVSQLSCSQPASYVLDSTDCNDLAYSSSNICNTILNLKLFVQGYYSGQNLMNSSRINQSNAGQLYVDDVTVELRDAVELTLIASKNAQLFPDGSVHCEFSSAITGSFYITVRGTNSIKTWSATPVTISAETLYDFSDASNKAFGDNMIEVSSGIWALISGDINNDGNVDNIDYSTWETDANEFASGVFATDLNGDGNVDNIDYSIWEANANNFVSSITPIP